MLRMHDVGYGYGIGVFNVPLKACAYRKREMVRLLVRICIMDIDSA